MPKTQMFELSEAPSFSNEWKPVLKRGIYTGLVATAGSYFLLGETLNSNVLGYSVISAVAVGTAAGVGSAASDLLSDYVINRLDQSQGIRTMENNLIKYGISGLGTMGALSLSSKVSPSIEGFAVGAAFKFAGDAVFQQVDANLLGMLF